MENAGTYELVVTNSGCVSETGETVVGVNAKPVTPILTSNSPICEGSTLEINTTATAQTYFWQAPDGTVVNGTPPLTISSTDALYQAGNWTLAVADANSCRSDDADAIAVIINELPVAFATNGGNVCHDADVQLLGNEVSGATYAWYDEVSGLPATVISMEQNPLISGLADGTHTFYLAISNNGCTSEYSSTQVTVNELLAEPNTTADFTLCEGSPIVLSSSTVADAYSWTGPNGFTSNLQNPGIIENSVMENAGEYKLVISINGCLSVESTVDVTVNSRPNAPVITNESIICNGEDLLLQTASNCSSLEWLSPQGERISTTENYLRVSADNAAYDAGSWTVSCIDENACRSDLAVATQVIINEIPATPPVSSNSPICEGEELQFHTPSSANTTYAWTGPNGYTSYFQNPQINQTSRSDAGNYSLVITRGGCSSQASQMEVVVNAIPDVPTPAVNSDVICNGATIELTAGTVADTYYWTGPNGFASNAANPVISRANLNHDGIYTLVVSTNACSSPAGTVIVDVLDIIETPVLSVSQEEICAGERLILATTPREGVSVSYTWFNEAGELGTTQVASYIINDATIEQSGGYYVFVNLDGCSSAPSSYEFVEVNPIPDKPVIWGENPICEDETFVLNTDDVADEYYWTGPDGFVSENRQPTAIEHVSMQNAGNYYLWVANKGCQSETGEFNLIVKAKPVQPNLFTNSPVCSGSDLILRTWEIDGEYRWLLPDGQEVTTVDSFLIISPARVDDSGVYAVQYLTEGCYSDASAEATVVVETILNEQAFAGVDFTVCDDGEAARLNAGNSTGRWTTYSNAIIVNPTEANTIITGLTQGETYKFYWWLNNGSCGELSVDSVDIKIAKQPNAVTDYVEVSENTVNNLVPILDNDELFGQNVFAEIYSYPSQANASLNPDNSATYDPYPDLFGSDEFVYEICLEACENMCDTAYVYVEIGANVDIPDIITPDGDGVNDTFEVVGIENYPENEIYIYNRWGNQVHHEVNYNNDWRGTYRNADLPAGTYYFIFYDRSTGEIVAKGYFTIHR